MGGQNTQAGSAAGKRKAAKGVVIGIIIAAAIIAAAAAVIRVTGIGSKSQALLRIAGLLDVESAGLDLEVSVMIGGEAVDVEAQIRSAAAPEDIAVYKITYSGLSFYYAEGAIFLEDGTTYRLTGDSGGEEAVEDTEEEAASDSFAFVLDYTTILSLIQTWYADTTTIEVNPEEEGTYYSITLDEESSLELLEALYPPAAALVSEMGALEVKLFAQSGEAKAIAVSGGATVGEGTALQVQAGIDILTGEEGTFAIPDAVLTAISAGDYEDASVLSEEVFRLAAAWNTLSGQDVIGADIGIGADFGLFSLYENLNWVRTADADGTAVNAITINGHTFYFTDDGSTYDFSGISDGDDAQTDDSLAEDEETAASIDPVFLLEIAYDVFMNGGISFSEEGGDYIYEVSLTQEQMETIVQTMFPDAENLDITYEDGRFTAVLTDNGFASLTLTCGGDVRILFADVSIDLEFDVEFTDAEELADYALPQATAGAA